MGEKKSCRGGSSWSQQVTSLRSSHLALSPSFWVLVTRYDSSTSHADSLAVDDVPLTRNLFFIASCGMHRALKGNIGIFTSVIAELTNETNIARGFSLLPI
jgi:hypothetical protein